LLGAALGTLGGRESGTARLVLDSTSTREDLSGAADDDRCNQHGHVEQNEAARDRCFDV
jgi:hypothetical protein